MPQCLLQMTVPLMLAVAGVWAAPNALPIPDKPDILYHVDPETNSLTPLESQMPAPRVAGSLVMYDFSGGTSPVRVATTRPTFVIRIATAPGAGAIFFQLDSVNGKRKLLLARGGKPLEGKSHPLEQKTLAPGVYALRPASPLSPGEYGIGMPAKNAYLFGVEANARAAAEPEERGAASPAEAGKGPDAEKRRILDSLLAKGLITPADHKAKLAELEAPAGPAGPEKRLRDLEGLLKKGLISPSDYKKKRAEILAEI